MPKKLTTEVFIERSLKIFDGYYNYSLVIYEKTDKEVMIICPVHGIFKQTPHHHLRGHGCKDCANIIIDQKKRKWTRDTIIKEFNIVHNNKFNYFKMKFKTINDYIEIICPIHGLFKQKANDHRRGIGCNKCAQETMKGSGNPNLSC